MRCHCLLLTLAETHTEPPQGPAAYALWQENLAGSGWSVAGTPRERVSRHDSGNDPLVGPHSCSEDQEDQPGRAIQAKAGGRPWPRPLPIRPESWGMPRTGMPGTPVGLASDAPETLRRDIERPRQEDSLDQCTNCSGHLPGPPTPALSLWGTSGGGYCPTPQRVQQTIRALPRLEQIRAARCSSQILDFVDQCQRLCGVVYLKDVQSHTRLSAVATRVLLTEHVEQGHVRWSGDSDDKIELSTPDPLTRWAG